MASDPAIEAAVPLRRRLGLPLLVLYGAGITVGAGIYVLIGAVAMHAGRYAPWSFVLAAAVMALTVASYAELATRFPVSAGEAAYVARPSDSRLASTRPACSRSSSAWCLGRGRGRLCRLCPAIRRSAAMSHRLYRRLGVLGVVAAWGIRNWSSREPVHADRGRRTCRHHCRRCILRPADRRNAARAAAVRCRGVVGIGYASLLAFFAFIGFEDLANVVEEAKVPHRDIPRAMVLTLGISTVLYVVVAAVAVSAVPGNDCRPHRRRSAWCSAKLPASVRRRSARSPSWRH